MRLLFGCFVALLVSGCATTIQPDKPDSGQFADPQPPRTTVFVPVIVQTKKIEKLANQEIPEGKIHSDRGRDGNSREWDYSVYRRGDVRVSGYKGKLRIKVPLEAKANGTQIICAGVWHDGDCWGATTHESASTTAAAKAIVDIGFALSPDYSISVDVSGDIKLTNDPHLQMDLFGDAIRINIDLSDIVDEAGLLDKNIPRLTKKLEKEVQEQVASVDLKSHVRRLWSELQQPIEAGDAWVQFVPRRVVYSGVTSSKNGEQLQVGVGASGPVRVSLTKPQHDPKPLPEVTETSQRKSIFEAMVPFHSAFDDLEKEINDDIGGREYSGEGYYLRIREIRLNGVSRDGRPGLLVSADFEGHRDLRWYDFLFNKVEGVLYFVALPKYDEDSRTVSVDDFEITSATSSAVVDAGLPWLVDWKKEEIKDELQLNLGPKLDRFKKQVAERLSAGRAFGEFTLTGAVTDLSIGGFYLDGNEVEVYVNIEGRLSVVR